MPFASVSYMAAWPAQGGVQRHPPRAFGPFSLPCVLSLPLATCFLWEALAMTKLNKQQVCDRLEISTRQLDYLIGRNEFPRGVSQGKAHKWLEEVVERFDR